MSWFINTLCCVIDLDKVVTASTLLDIANGIGSTLLDIANGIGST